MLDTRLPLETPEGIELVVTPAGPSARLHAYLLDLLIRCGIYLAFFIPLHFFGRVGSGLFLIIYFLLEWFYPVLFEGLRGGQTPGKRYCRLRVLSADGTPLTFGGAMIRNLLRIIDIMPTFYVFGLLSMLMTQRFQRLGDLAAGTLVVFEPRPAIAAPDPDAGASPLPVALSTVEQRGLIDFAERRQQLSADRQVELADILGPLTHQSGEEGVNRLRAFANSLIGRSA